MYENQSQQAKAVLIVRQGTQAGMSFPITSSYAIIGREEGVNIVIQDPEASRRHARISWQGGQFILEDLGSTNGTFINGIQITAPQLLNPGDSIGIGQMAIVFQLVGTMSPGHVPQYPGYVAQQPPPPTFYNHSPSDFSQGNSYTLQYVLYGFGCVFLLCICSVSSIAGAIILFPEFFEAMLG
jgi:hypothetical protein